MCVCVCALLSICAMDYSEMCVYSQTVIPPEKEIRAISFVRIEINFMSFLR